MTTDNFFSVDERLNYKNIHSQKRCSQCFETKPLDIINFRYKKTEKRWVGKCRQCERRTRNKANKRKRVLEKRKQPIKTKSIISGRLAGEKELSLAGTLEQALAEINHETQ